MLSEELMRVCGLPIEEMRKGLLVGQFNPNDLVGLGDALLADCLTGLPKPGVFLERGAPRELIERFMRAEILLSFGIKELEADPGKLEHDIELGLAYSKWAALLIGFGRIGHAREVLKRALRTGYETESMRSVLASLPSEDMPATHSSEPQSIRTSDAEGRTAMGSAIDFEGAKKLLGKYSFMLSEMGDYWSVSVNKKMAGHNRLVLYEICKIEPKGQSLNVIVLNLPTFFGPNWRALTNNQPQIFEATSIEEVLQLFQSTVGQRMVDGVLYD